MKSTMLRVQIARSVAELEGLRSAWETLFARINATLFQSFEWNRLAARVFEEMEAPCVLFAESDSGMAIIPAAHRTASNTFCLMGEELFDYRDYLAAGDPACLRAAWETLAHLGLPLEVKALRGPQVEERWRWLEPVAFCEAPIATPNHEIGSKSFRSLRRLLRMGSRIREHSGSNTGLVRWIYEQKAQQQGTSLFQDPRRRSFLEAAIHLPSSCSEIFTLELQDQILAVLVTFRDGETRRFYTSYFDRQWAKFSPGYALLSEVVQRTLESGMACDFMTGEHRYKGRLANSSAPLFQVRARTIDMHKYPEADRAHAA